MKILIYSYNYYPEPIGIAPLMTELAEGLVKRGHQVRIVTAMPNYPERRIYEEYRGQLFSTTERNGVLIQRSFVWVKPKPNFLDRLLLDGSFIVTSLFQAFRGWRPEVILTTSPPLPVCIPSLLLRSVYDAPIVLSLQDILPEAAVKVGLLTNQTSIKVFEALEQFSYRTADAIGVICDAFAENLVAKGVPAEKLALVPNWVDVNFIRPLPKDENAFRIRHGLEGKFVVMYSGNIALTQGLKTAIEAAAELQAQSEIIFVIVGEAKALSRLEQLCQERNLSNVLLLPFQPRQELPQMLAAADVGLVIQKHGAVSFNMPSKIPVLLASGRAVIGSVPSVGTAARAISESGGGLVVPPEDPKALAAAVETLYKNPELSEELAKKGRNYAVKTYCFDKILRRYEGILEEAIVRGQRQQVPSPNNIVNVVKETSVKNVSG